MTEIRKYSTERIFLPAHVAEALKSLRSDLLKIGGVRSVVLFGSYSKGTYGPDSDIDVAVFIADEMLPSELEIYRQASRAAAEYPLDIQILIFNEAMLTDPAGIVAEITEFGYDLCTL